MVFRYNAGFLRPPRPKNIRSHFFRPASTPSTLPSRLQTSVRVFAFVASGIVLTAYYFDSRSIIHRHVFPPLLRASLDAEKCHRLAVKALAGGFVPTDDLPDDSILETEIWGHRLPSPVSLAAGFDKDAEAIKGLFGLGFSWVEIGSVTPKAQSPNPAPRVFRLEEDSAIINRYGFPSVGAALVASRIRSFLSLRHDLYSSRILAINLGKNKTSAPDSVDDYTVGVRTLGPFADVLVINVSSPNTPGLRGLQSPGLLIELLNAVINERDQLPRRQVGMNGTKWERPKLVVKIAPDLSANDIEGIAEAVRQSGIDGVIVSNTTVQRPSSLLSAPSKEAGGLSGPPLMPLSLAALRTLRTLLPGSVPIFGCGGISTAADAITFAESGATAIQLWTSFAYEGAGTPRRLKDELTSELKKRGLTWMDVVRTGQRKAGSALKQPVEDIPLEEREAVFKEESDTLMTEAFRLQELLQQVNSALVTDTARIPKDGQGLRALENREIARAVESDAESTTAVLSANITADESLTPKEGEEVKMMANSTSDVVRGRF
ncbi:uncharacterized protein EI90DRAFT_3075233 [Cantharellus anzutake]|uniref:uncharacterized protein n=1 Tax=Cantharellus anzutake TaxID=1750568 RepID=UPI001904636A|nr:uncharacterized protein EI90DRAFT_3075233 [Cantharellus anzutake]KAF8324619.1 hypothetical protein EI90DRAFT_3075233 [Cantharellus anzutake]